MRFRPELQGLRGVAVALVVLYHDDVLRGGWIGVDVFFALSGVLITGLLLAEWEATGRIALGPFFMRRARRLLPAMCVFLAVAAAVDHTLAPFGFAYTADVALVHHGAIPGLAHLWSLALEEQFYLVWPLALLILLRLGTRRQLVGMLALALGIGSLVQTQLLAGDGIARIYYAPDTHAAALMLGCAAALWGLERARRALSAVSVLILLALFADRESATAFATWSAPVALASVAIVLAAEDLRFLRAPVLLRLGDYSYSLYLWHFFLLSALGLLGLVLALPVAAASFHWVEDPIRRLRRQRVPGGRAGEEVVGPLRSVRRDEGKAPEPLYA